MTWTYQPSSLASSKKDQVRLLVGDVTVSDQQIADEEINFALTLRSSIYGAAAECCRFISARYSRLVDQTTAGAGGNMHMGYAQRARAYTALAASFDGRAALTGSGPPYAGGISVADKQTNEANSDRVAPQYAIGMEDNTLPVGSLGNETMDDQA